MLLKKHRLQSRLAIGRRLSITSIAFAFFSIAPAISADTVKIAFTGDQGVGEHAQSLLRLVQSEGADLLMIQGDLGYSVQAAAQWETNNNDALGRNFPILTLVGNHENFEWPIYQSLTRQRLDRSGALSCSGNLGVKAACQIGNIDIVQVSPGINEVEGVQADDNYPDYIRSTFANNSNRWRICAWHKNQNALQTGRKGDSTGWGVYDACLDAGAMVVVAHEHAYSRSYLLSDFENQTVVNRESDMILQSGQSFVAVSGLGGREVRPQRRGGDWWASVYTASQGATHGALFCEFGDVVAECYFKAIDGSIPDQFTLRRGAQPHTDRAAYVFSRNDTDEFRWIDRTEQGVMGNVWIDRECAEQLGGASVYGDWNELRDLAPAMDSISNPCDNVPAENGYVFSRTDTEEYRWVDRNATGEMGNVWIDQACAMLLGDASASGDWNDLVGRAPAMDSIANPCLTGSPTNDTTGYVYSRTDVAEYRWVEGDGNIWITEECAASLGGASASGAWVDLNEIAPRFDAIANPCN